MTIIDTIKTLLEPVKKRVYLMVSRAIINLVDDSTKTQLLQLSVLKDEILANVERIQEFGFSSNPLPGAQAVLLCVGGHRGHPIVIATDDKRYRKNTLAGGETSIYNSAGDYIWIKADGTIEIKASTRVTITSPEVHMTGNLIVDGTSTLTGLVTAPAGVRAVGGLSSSGAPVATQITDGAGDLGEMRTIYNSHHHPQSGGGTTNVPNEPMT